MAWPNETTCLTSPDHNGGRRLEGVLRHFKVLRRRAFADTSRSIVVRTMARAEIAAVLALRLALRGAKRHAAQVSAHAKGHQPVVMTFLDALLVGFRVAQVGKADGALLHHFFLRTVPDENRLALPHDLDRLAHRTRRQVNLDRGKRAGVRGRIHSR